VIFENDDPEVGAKYLVLLDALDGTQLCLDDEEGLWTENWTGRPIPDETARELCAGCKFLEECADYAVAAQEEHGIWGGTTYEMRKQLKFKIKHGEKVEDGRNSTEGTQEAGRD